MMIEPPSCPSSGLYVVFVRSIAAALALAGADAGAETGGVDAAADADGDGVAAVPHAANTRTAPASNPTRRFRINTPPTECVSPHCWSQAAASRRSAPTRRHSPGSDSPDWAGQQRGALVPTVSDRLLRSGNYGHGAHRCQIASGGFPLGSAGSTSFRSGWMLSGLLRGYVTTGRLAGSFVGNVPMRMLAR